MKYSIVYSSTGNTKLLADALKESLDDNKLVYYGAPDKYALDADLIFIGFWTNQGVCDDTTKAFLRKIHNKKVFLFGSCGFAEANYYKQILKSTKEFLDETVTVVGEFMCQGKMHDNVREKYLKLKETDPTNPKFDMLLGVFDEAKSHPNLTDFNNLIEKARKLDI